MPKITISDETVSGAKVEAFDLDFASGTITLRGLIASRVEEEARRYQAQAGEIYHGLVQSTDSERLINGYCLLKRREIVAETQVQKALQSFERNGFFVLVNDRQIESLDEEIEIGLRTQVSFVKLVPLVGG